jgi:hypothetical protein
MDFSDICIYSTSLYQIRKVSVYKSLQPSLCANSMSLLVVLDLADQELKPQR